MAIGELPNEEEEVTTVEVKTSKSFKVNFKEIDSLLLEMAKPENKEFQEQMKEELVHVKEKQKEMENKSAVVMLKLDTQTLRSLRQFRNPKPLVHEITIAFLLLLGEHEADTRVFSMFYQIYQILTF